MEVKPGYKQTEVGVIPEDWDVESLDRIADPKRSICYGIVQVGQFSNNGITVLAIKNLNGDYATNLHRCSYEIEKPYTRSRVHPGDVLVSVKGTIGRIGLVPPHFVGNISRDLARISLTDLDVPQFWYQMLQSEMAQRRLEATTVGTTRMELSIGPLKLVKMPRPPKREQCAIAAALSDVDALIGALDQLIAKKRDLKQAAMQQLLTGQKRLPGFQGEWAVKKLGDVAHIKTGSLNNEDKVEDGQYPFFVRSETVERINTYSHDCEAILVPGEGRIGSIFHYIQGRFDVHQRVYAITQFKPDISARFAHLYMAKNFGAWAMQNTVKATVDSLRLPTFQTFEMRVPPTLKEQTAIAEVLSDMDAELAALEQRRDKTRALKQGMMQELLTGRTRLV
jgi:type I restriction enzyme S subunit